MAALVRPSGVGTLIGQGQATMMTRGEGSREREGGKSEPRSTYAIANKASLVPLPSFGGVRTQTTET
ncbi:unnamed protein product [Arctogadus glacialis]